MERGHITEVDKDTTIVPKSSDFIRLDIACGNALKEGFIGIDISPETQASVITDLEIYPWADIKDNSVGEINCSHYIEQVTDLRKFAAELYRILVPGGFVTIVAPYYSHRRATQDPTHKQMISEGTFFYWNKAWIDSNKLHHYNMNCNFDVLSTKFLFEPDWNTRSTLAKEWARQHYINVVMEIEVILMAIKNKEV